MALETVVIPARPPIQQLWDTPEEAHQALIELFDDVLAELEADGVKPPTFREFYKEFRKMWNVWQKYAPH